jgi:hypothetical protein
MARRASGVTHLPSPAGRLALPALHIAALLLLSAASTLCAQPPQSDPPPPPAGPTFTLHVYDRLVQLPTLVLSPDHEPLPPLEATNFNVSLDGGPRFHPSSIRLEGDDPLSLAIFLDLSGSQNDLLYTLGPSLADWLTHSLRPNDRITIYAGDCTLIRSGKNLSPDAAIVRADLQAALQVQQIHNPKNHSRCETFMPLRDFLFAIMRDLSTAPGRRVVIAIASGADDNSRLDWKRLRTATASDAVTVFGFGIPRPFTSGPAPDFNAFCEESGGLYLTTTTRKAPQDLNKVTDFIRGRYILEFPTPFNPTTGTHVVDVSLHRIEAFIRPSTVTVPLADPAIDKDANTIPTDTSKQPRIGNHRPPQIP